MSRYLPALSLRLLIILSPTVPPLAYPARLRQFQLPQPGRQRRTVGCHQRLSHDFPAALALRPCRRPKWRQWAHRCPALLRWSPHRAQYRCVDSRNIYRCGHCRSDLVQHQQPAALITELLELLQIVFVGNSDAPFALNRLDKYSTDIRDCCRLWSLVPRISLNGPRAKPRTRGSKPAWTLRLPEAVNVARVRPWKALSITKIVGSLMPSLLPYSRAIFIAASLASAPELPKNTLLMPLTSQSLSARAC